jgi:hypothetical protein
MFFVRYSVSVFIDANVRFDIVYKYKIRLHSTPINFLAIAIRWFRILDRAFIATPVQYERGFLDEGL